MAGRGGGNCSPSYNQIVANRNKETNLHRFKKSTKGITEDPNTGNIKPHEQRENHEEDSMEKRKEGSSRKDAPLRVIEGYKPKSTNTPWVILSDPVLQVHRDHIVTHAIICKFMWTWLTEKALHARIRYHWKPKVEINLHLGSKGSFTVVFTSLEDKDKVFEGGPYFYTAAGLYMRPWVINFVPE